MKFPYYVCPVTKQQKQIFEDHFTQEDNRFYFEGIWFRNQRPENKEVSGYVDESTQKRRYVQFHDAYEIQEKDEQDYLAIKDTFVYVSNTYSKPEIEAYEKKVLLALNKAGFKVSKKNIFTKDNMQVELIKYDVHPKNNEGDITFPKDYMSLDVIIRTKNYDCQKENDRMWTLSTKMFRLKDKRQEPTYINSIEEIEDYLPAQIEMGCGPSIEVGIPPLFEMHESYKVQNHDTGKFYFAEEDDLIVNIITNPEKMYERFSYVPKTILKSEPTKAYNTFAELYKKGVFTGTVLNNNFDRLVKRYNIDEKILRIYDKATYLPQINFDKNAKSLICIGAHADRRQVQRQARKAGKKVIFIDPEGFYTKDGFEEYPIEGPQTSDFIYKTTFEKAMQELADKYLQDKKQINIKK
jgi:hypothetical protein